MVDLATNVLFKFSKLKQIKKLFFSQLDAFGFKQ